MVERSEYEDIRSQVQDILDQSIYSFPSSPDNERVEKQILIVHKDLCSTNKGALCTLEDMIYAIQDYNMNLCYEASFLLLPVEYDLSDQDSIVVRNNKIYLKEGFSEFDDDFNQTLDEYASWVMESISNDCENMEAYLLMVFDKYKISITADDLYLTGVSEEVIVGDAQILLVPEMLANGVTNCGDRTILHYSYMRGVATIG